MRRWTVLAAAAVLAAGCMGGGAHQAATSSSAGPQEKTTAPTGTRTPTSAEPAPETPLGDRAVRLVRAVTLTPKDWGPGYVPQQEYEDESLTRYSFGDNCKAAADGVTPGAVAAMARYTYLPDGSGGERVFAVSVATAYQDEDAARADFEQVRADAERCPAQTLSNGERVTSIRVVDAASVLPDADESVAVEATWVAADGDRNGPYVWVVARRGTVTVSSLAVDLRPPTESSTEDLVVRGVTLMVTRVKQELPKG
ncbi:hypothetical protein [Yinghuangia seranimata]|uniref:hypothetical protein n=1 Tax=Yinghuangia seranimata TaxID=408067 RepID=UPI00248D1DE2|nr:hypothetical protein [Yinghuangia seranimata]MDI2124923.1 hypothetical protein [Yinghuangia seranimata]